MIEKTRNINWKIEVLLLVVYELLYAIQLYAFDEKYFQTIVSALSVLKSIIVVLYGAFGFAIFTDIPIQNIFKKTAYSGVSTAKILISILVGLIIAFYVYFKWQVNGFAGPFSLLILHIATIVAMVAVFTKAKIMAKRALYRLGVATLLFVVVKVLPTYYFLEIKYRNHPQYIEAVKKLETNPYDTAAYVQYMIETEKLLKYSKSIH